MVLLACCAVLGVLGLGLLVLVQLNLVYQLMYTDDQSHSKKAYASPIGAALLDSHTAANAT